MKHLILVIMACLMPLQYASAWGRFDGGIHPRYYGYHRDPVIIHNTYVTHRSGGCIGCGIAGAAAVGLVGGAIIGAAIASSDHTREVVVEPVPAPTTTVVYAAPPPPPPPVYGSQIAVLPPGCSVINVNGVTYYRCAQYWYQPYMGGNGVYYTLIPPPM